MIYITAKRNGFYRCGIAHSDQTTAYPDDHFTPEQLAALEAEPMLIVTRDNPQTATQEAAEQQIAALKQALTQTQQHNAELREELNAAHARLAELTGDAKVTTSKAKAK